MISKMMIPRCLIVFFVTTTRVLFLDAFTVLPATHSRHAYCRQQVQDDVVALLMASSEKEEEQDEEKRMEMVRMLQKTFYSSSEVEDEESRVSTATRFEETTGRMLNLPLWRVGWVEVPGRSNCLNVHEGHYTNMFEKILRDNNNDEDGSPTSRYFGHIYLPGGTKSSRTNETRFQLKDWQQEIDDLKRFDEKERSSVIGCLMRITDYRRLQDGRLVLLVQALERFVVDTVIESFPHGVAHVQLLPDIEDTLSATTSEEEDVDENFGKISRAKAIRQSFKYHDYECDPTMLPLPKDAEYMSAQDVFGSAIAKCLPFCRYAQDDSMLDKFEQQRIKEEEDCDDQGTSSTDETKNSITSEAGFACGQPLLENRLQADLILRDPPPLPGVARRQTDDIDAIEKLFWLELEDFCRNYQFQLPDEILCLMPPDMGDYLDLERSEHPISVKYPVRRRQRRLSYAVPRLIENFPIGSAIPTRQILLAAPGTRARLLAVLERLEYLNNAVLGQFE